MSEKKPKHIKKDKKSNNKYHQTKPRFVATVVLFICSIISVLVGISLLDSYLTYTSYGVMSYGILSPVFFSFTIGIFGILALALRHNYKNWKLCATFSLVGTIGLALTFSLLMPGYFLSMFVVIIATCVPMIVSQIIILTTNNEKKKDHHYFSKKKEYGENLSKKIRDLHKHQEDVV